MIYIGDKKLKSCYLGGEAIGKVYRGDELLFEKKSRLPAGYTEVRYIEGTGTQYIDTGIKPNAKSRIVMDVELTAIKASYASYFFDSATTSTAVSYNYVFRVFASINGTVSAAMGSYYKTISSVVLDSDNPLKRMTLQLDAPSKTGMIDGKETAVGNSTFSTSMNNLRLLDISNNNTGNFRAPAKLYSCQIYTSDITTRDFIPCIDPTGAVGLYDSVEGKFHGNAGTGAFTAGPTV